MKWGHTFLCPLHKPWMSMVHHGRNSWGGEVPGAASHGSGTAEESLDIEGVTVVVEVANCSEGKAGAGNCESPLRKRDEGGGSDGAFDRVAVDGADIIACSNKVAALIGSSAIGVTRA